MIALSIVAICFSLFSFVFSVINFIELRAMHKSTHSIQYIPADELDKTVPRDDHGFEVVTDELKEKLVDFDDEI